MMTRDDFKNLLVADVDDKAGQIDNAVNEYSDALYRAEDAERELETAKTELENARKTIGELTETNMKLLEKVKYSDDAGADDKNGPTPDEITIEDLFKEED